MARRHRYESDVASGRGKPGGRGFGRLRALAGAGDRDPLHGGPDRPQLRVDLAAEPVPPDRKLQRLDQLVGELQVDRAALA
jgi:hypothetical protein